MKNRIFRDAISSSASDDFYKALFNRYMEKYRALWMGAYKWEGVSLEASQYAMRKLWEEGNIAAFLKGSALLSVIAFAPWAQFDYNGYRDPSKIMIVNENNGSNYPSASEKLEVVYDENQPLLGKNAVIGYAQSNREPVREIVTDYVKLILECEMTIRIALIGARQPFLFSVTPETKQKAEDLSRKLMAYDPILFVDGSTAPSFLANGSPFIIDKLYQLKQDRENELLTYLGIDNEAIEKKERLTIDETNSNNAEINDHGEAINSQLTEFAKLMSYAFKKKVTISANVEKSASVHEGGKEDENGNDNADDK